MLQAIPIRILASFLLVSSGFQANSIVDAATSVVDLGYAKYEGSFNATTGNTQFLGVRYAASPTGPLRWREPQTPSSTPGILQANAQPNSCLQASSGTAPTSPFRTTIQNREVILERRAPAVGSSEDCLFLNVFVPGNMNKADLPVVVWIHGGGYVAGGASTFDGNDLIREASGGVIAVIIQYRLGIFGFLPGAKVKAGGALNAGLLDQQFALRWVQQHIQKFGGDKGKVTIWGESAGAGSVIQHVVANDGKTTPPLFRGAISSSLYLPSQYAFNDPIPERLFSEAVSQTNCSTAKDALNCLRNVDVNILQTTNTVINRSGFFGTFVFVPVVDGTFITQRPTQLLAQRKLNGEIALSVTNTFEGAAFVNASTAPTVQVTDYVAQLFPRFGPRETAAAAAQYKNLGTPIFQVIAIMGEAIFICPTYFFLRAFTGRSFKGEFAIPPGGHGMDVGFYFPSTNANGVPVFNNTAFDKAFSESFLNFVLSLNPNIKSDPADITPQWNLWNGEVEMLFNKTEAGAPVVQPTTTSDALLQRCNFWESVSALSAQ